MERFWYSFIKCSSLGLKPEVLAHCSVVHLPLNHRVLWQMKAQINNPELKVRGLDPLISTLIDKLQNFNQLDAEKAKLKLERWASRDAGSGGGRSEELETSGDCDDEDGCQGSGDRIHTADILKDKKTHPENRNEPKPTVRKIVTTTTASTVKSSSKHSVTGSGSSAALSSSLVILTALAVLWPCPP